MTFTLGSIVITMRGTQLPFERSEQRRQIKLVTAGGTPIVYDRGWSTKIITLVIDDLESVIEDALDFLNVTVLESVTPFAYTPDAGVDAGNGAGNSVSVRCWQDEPLRPTQISPGRKTLVVKLRIEV